MNENIKINQIEFSVRTQNILYDLGIEYLHELCEFGEKNLLDRRNCGKITIDEIKTILSRYNLNLKDDNLIFRLNKHIGIINTSLFDIATHGRIITDHLKYIYKEIDSLKIFSEKMEKENKDLKEKLKEHEQSAKLNE